MSATVALTPPTSSAASPAPLEGEAAELVGRLHRIVGESLTAAHSAHEDEGRGRLSVPDERALARKLLADELRRHVKSMLAPYKYPRWIEFVTDLPKTATGKIQRFRLRAMDRPDR